MIVDIHSHVWEYPRDFGEDFRRQARRARGDRELDLTVRYEEYRRECPHDVVTVIFGGKARLSARF